MNYETKYMTKSDLVESIFQSTSRLIDLNEKYGICDPKRAGIERIRLQLERRITKEVQDTLEIPDQEMKWQKLKELNEIYRDPLLSYSYVITSED